MRRHRTIKLKVNPKVKAKVVSLAQYLMKHSGTPRCSRCGRPLSAHRSIDRGMGDRCALDYLDEILASRFMRPLAGTGR